MGRPSKKAERLEQILQAFQRCVARFGLEGSTLERIAEESGLQRSLVRHFAGNRGDLVQQLADRVIQQSDQSWSEFLDYLPKQNGSAVMIEMLFDANHSDPEFVLVVESLIFAAGADPKLRKQLQAWMERFCEGVESVLLVDYPDAEKQKLQTVAFGIVSIYFNLDSLAPLGMSERYRHAARQSAELLLQGLR